MKFLLTVFICSVTGGDCYTNPSYPKTFDNHYECMRAGLVDAYEILIADGKLYRRTNKQLTVVS